MKKIRIALIGFNTNSHSRQVHSRIREMSDIFEVVGYVLPENERERMPQRMSVVEGLPEMTMEQVLSDPTIEAVAIETDEIYLTKYALMAAKAGKHIHMEKPGGRELADFEAMIEAVKEHGTVFCPGYMYRYNPYVQDVLAQAKEGKLGPILCVEAQMSCTHAYNDRQWLDQFPGGMMFYLGCHLIDIIYQLQGEPLKIHPMSRPVGINGVTASDFGFVVMEYPNGISFAKCISTERGGFQRRQLVVTAKEATVEINPLEKGPEAGMRTYRTVRNEKPWHTPYAREESPEFDRYNTMLRSFAAYVRGEKENPYTPDYELNLYKLLLRCCGENID